MFHRLKFFFQKRLPALRSRNFRFLWMGLVLSMIGTQMQFWAINWHVYLLTHSALALGLVGLIRVIPIVLFSLWGGVAADVWDRRRILWVTQTVMALAAGGLAYLTWTNRIQVSALYILTALSAAGNAFDIPARQSLLPNLVPREDFSNAAALTSMGFQLATVLGPLLAGVFIAGNHLAAIYALNAVSFLAVFVALGCLRYRRTVSPEGIKRRKGFSFWWEGFSFVFRTPVLGWSLFIDALGTFFASANTLLPIFARDILKIGGRGYGLLAGAQAVGSLTAGGAVSLLSLGRRQGWLLVASVFIYGLATVVFGLSHLFWLTYGALVLAGAVDAVSTIIRQTIRQLSTPDSLRGRVTSVNMIFFLGGPQLGEFEAGLAASWLGAPGSVVLGGVFCVLATLGIAWRAKSLRGYRWEGEGMKEKGERMKEKG